MVSAIVIPGLSAIRVESTCNRIRTKKRGLTLFEVLLSLAIFAGATAAIGQLLAGGVRGAIRARLQTQAILRCESKLAEVVSGAQTWQAASNVPFPDDPQWLWSLAISPGPRHDLLLLEVTATHSAGHALSDVNFKLNSLRRDPFLVASAAAASSTANTGTNSSGTSGSSNSTAGGK